MLWLETRCCLRTKGKGARPIFELLISKGVISIRRWRAMGKKPQEGGNLGGDSAAAPDEG